MPEAKSIGARGDRAYCSFLHTDRVGDRLHLERIYELFVSLVRKSRAGFATIVAGVLRSSTTMCAP
jgi:hypothetical protein